MLDRHGVCAVWTRGIVALGYPAIWADSVAELKLIERCFV